MQNLLLLHGALGSESELIPLKELLKDKFNIYTFNFEGHGGLGSDNDFSMDLFSENLLAFLDSNNIESTLVFGFSLGGYATLNAAINHPQRFEKIMTLGSKFGWSPEIAEKERKLINPQKIEVKIPKYASYLSDLHQPQDWRTIMNKVSEMIKNLGNGAALTLEEFSKINNECYIGVGEKDTMVGIAETKAVADVIPNATFYILEESEHPINKIDPNKLAERILKFFN